MRVLAIFGPTACGKSAVAEEIARRLPAELVSVDSMQAYRGLPILTNQSSFPTHLVGIWPLSHEGSVGEYQELAHRAIDGIVERRRLPVVVGGTGLYLRAAVSELPIPPEPTPGLRRRLEDEYERVGPEGAHTLLAARDPAAARVIHPNDRRRVVRALELAALGSSLRPADSRLWAGDTRHPTAIVGLELPQDELDRRIEARSRTMFQAGVEEEVRQALARPISATARQVFGLEEIASLPRRQALDVLVQKTRRYARYQLKWMRRIPGLVTVRAHRPAVEVADDVLEVVRARERLPARRAGQGLLVPHARPRP